MQPVQLESPGQPAYPIALHRSATRQPGRRVALPWPALPLLAVLAVTGPALAAQLHVSTSTSALFDELQAWDGSLVPRRSIVQQLQLGANDLAGDGQGKLALGGVLRIGTDFGVTYAQAAALDGYEERSLAVPYLVLEGRELWGGRLDLGLGRQLLVEPLDFVLFDGARATLRGPGHLGIEALGGWLVRREVSLVGLEDLEPDGTPLGLDDSPTFGGSLLVHGLDWLRARLSYRQERDGPDVGRSALALSAGLQPVRWVALDAGWVRDLLGQRDEELSAWLTLHWPSPLRWTAKVAQVAPRLDAGSIFAMFDLQPVQTWSLHGEARLGGWLIGAGVLHRRFFDETAADAAGTTLPRFAGSPAASAEGLDLQLRWQPRAAWQLHGTGYLRQGYGGERASLAAGASWTPDWPPQATFGGMARWVHLADDISPWRAGELLALDLSGSLLLWERARLQLVLEQATGPWRPGWLRALALLDVEYWR